MLASTYPRWRDDPEPGFVHELARRLVDRFDIVAVVPHAPGAAVDERMDGVRVVRYRYAPAALETLVQGGGMMTHVRRSPWKWLLVPGFLAMQWVVARRFRTADAIVHAHWIIPQGLVARLLRKPYLVTSHGADLFTLTGTLPTRIKAFVLAGAAKATVVSAAMASVVRASFGHVRTPSVRSMGVDLSDRFTPASAPETRTTGELLFVGRLVEKKGVRFLIEALPTVLARYPHATLSIVGGGPLERELQVLAQRLGIAANVTFVGAVAQAALPAYYRRAALCVLPFVRSASGDQEGLGLTAVEALGCGCPLVVGAVPAVKDVVDIAPSVRVVDGDDVAALAEACCSLLENVERSSAAVLRDRPGLVGRFDWASVADDYAAMLDEVGQ